MNLDAFCSAHSVSIPLFNTVDYAVRQLLGANDSFHGPAPSKTLSQPDSPLSSPFPNPPPSPSTGSPELSRALQLLSLTLSDAASLLTDVSSDRDTVAAHLDSSVSLLDVCNVASAEVDRLLLRRLNLCLALHILSSESGRTPEKLKRARDSLAQWRASPRRSLKPSAQDLVRSLAPADAPRGRISAVRRAIYAVEIVSKLIVGAAVAVLLGGGGGTLSAAPVPADLPWGKEYKELAAAVSSKLVGDGFAEELEAAEVAADNLTVVMDQIIQNVDGGNGERLRNAVDETEKATGVLSKGLDDLSSAVNELFHSALGLRDTALQGFRVGTQRCK